MLKVGAILTLVFLLGFITGALVYANPRHCRLNVHKCRKTRARLNMWAKRYKRKVEELTNDTK